MNSWEESEYQFLPMAIHPDINRLFGDKLKDKTMSESTHAERHLLVHPGKKINLSEIDSTATPGTTSSKAELDQAVAKLHVQLEELQGRLWAESKRSLLMVLQALDTGGKDGTIRRVFGGVNPQGVDVSGFRAPIGEELKHDFLWRIYSKLPAKGEIGIFNRSHYEDVVATKVLSLIDSHEQERRINTIKAFESNLANSGTTIIKIFLHISKDEQKKRLQERIDIPEKNWKFSSADLETRKLWTPYMETYSSVISQTSFDFAPWYVVPARHKWYRDWAIVNLLVDTITKMNPQYPPPEPNLSKVVIK